MNALPPDIERLIAELEAAARDASSLVEGLSEEGWARRPRPGAWSIAECMEHLAAGNRVYLEAMRAPARVARERGLFRKAPARPGLIGGIFVRSLEPPPKWWAPMKSPRIARPRPAPPRVETIAAFLATQAEFGQFVRASADLDLNVIRFPNPFVRGIRFSLATGLHVINAHNRRHLVQARNVLREIVH